MKVLQTLGQRRNAQEGVFQYKRTSLGVVIDATIGRTRLDPAIVELSHEEWATIIREIETAEGATLRLTQDGPFECAPYTSIWEVVRRAVPLPAGGWYWQNSWAAYVGAILEHEGTIDLYGGALGRGHTALICLRRHSASVNDDDDG